MRPVRCPYRQTETSDPHPGCRASAEGIRLGARRAPLRGKPSVSNEGERCDTICAMPYNAERHRRRSIRLPAWDYAGHGWYFITIVTAVRECRFGEVVGDEVVLSGDGVIVEEEWQRAAQVRAEVSTVLHVVMPNHLHAIVAMHGDGDPKIDDRTALKHALGDRRPLHRAPRSLGALVAGFKSAATSRIEREHDAPGMAVWQRGFYEHIIRDDRDLERISDYIVANPSRWHDDALHPAKPPFRPPGRRRRTS